MSWAVDYLGIPEIDHGRDRTGCDCWGLCRLVLREVAGIDAPGYDEGYVSADEAAEVTVLIAGATSSPLWRRVEDPRSFDIAIIRKGGLARHAGIVVQPGMMLHMWGGHARIERYDGDLWRNRLVGFYRWSAP
jgi:cell wall-associated NlpC family hydrolase